MALCKKWITEGFNAFRAGAFGNGGQNLYVSRAGVLQRIYQYDLNQNGYIDLLFCNSQNHCESVPAYVFEDPFGICRKIELPAQGAITGLAADLTGNGWDDLVVGMKYDGKSVNLNSAVYYGSPAGFSEQRMNFLPTPWCEAVTAGDFKGTGRKALAFVCRKQIRIFYSDELGIEARRFVDLDIPARQLAAADLDQDGYDDLVIRNAQGETLIFWGGQDGIDSGRFSRLDFHCPPLAEMEAQLRKQSDFERTEEPEPLLQVIEISGLCLITAVTQDDIHFFTITKHRHIAELFKVACPCAQAVAFGDLTGQGNIDMVIAARQQKMEGEISRFYPGTGADLKFERWLEIPTWRACDVAIADWNGDGRNELVICQAHSPTSFTGESLLFAGLTAESVPEPRRVVTEDSRRCLAVKRPGMTPLLVFVNHYSRSLVGSDKVRLYFGGPDGYSKDNFTELPGWCAVEGLYADINDDGIGDLVITNCAENSLWLDPGSFIHINSANGFDPAKMIRLPTKATHGCVCADLNHNGYLDLLFTSFADPYITIFHGGPDGMDVKRPIRIKIPGKKQSCIQPRWIYLVDLNRDGWLDLVIPMITSDRSYILWGGPQGFSFDRCLELAVYRGSCVRAADLNGNGYPDLIIGGHMVSPSGGLMPPREPHDSFVYIYWNGPDGICESNRTVLRADGVNSMAIADFNNDGMLDLFVGSYHNGEERDINSFIYWNRRGIGFRNSDCTRLPTHSVSGSIAADFNEDGYIDLAVANHKVWGDHQGFSSVWWNGPDGFDIRKRTDLPTSGPHGISSVEPGNQLDRGPEEYYTSSVYKTETRMRIKSIVWKGETPPKTWVKVCARAADTEITLTDTAWSEYFVGEEAFAGNAPSGKFFQYKLALGAKNSLRSPRLTEVVVAFVPAED